MPLATRASADSCGFVRHAKCAAGVDNLHTDLHIGWQRAEEGNLRRSSFGDSFEVFAGRFSIFFVWNREESWNWRVIGVVMTTPEAALGPASWWRYNFGAHSRNVAPFQGLLVPTVEVSINSVLNQLTSAFKCLFLVINSINCGPWVQVFNQNRWHIWICDAKCSHLQLIQQPEAMRYEISNCYDYYNLPGLWRIVQDPKSADQTPNGPGRDQNRAVSPIIQWLLSHGEWYTRS